MSRALSLLSVFLVVAVAHADYADDVIYRYLDAWRQRNVTRAQDCLAANFQGVSPTITDGSLLNKAQFDALIADRMPVLANVGINVQTMLRCNTSAAGTAYNWGIINTTKVPNDPHPYYNFPGIFAGHVNDATDPRRLEKWGFFGDCIPATPNMTKLKSTVLSMLHDYAEYNATAVGAHLATGFVMLDHDSEGGNFINRTTLLDGLTTLHKYMNPAEIAHDRVVACGNFVATSTFTAVTSKQAGEESDLRRQINVFELVPDTYQIALWESFGNAAGRR